MRYGVPYKGSKNAIVKWVIDNLPKADTFVDLFAGGCAVTHGAMLSGKYRNFIVNDINDVPQLFLDAVGGKFKDERRWIDRETFNRLKDTDEYVATCWSFGNNRRDYLYGRHIEPWKKALHYARVLGDRSLLRDMGIESDGSRLDVKAHHQEYAHKYRTWLLKARHIATPKTLQRLDSLGRLESCELLQSLNNLERLQSLQSLQRLQSLKNLESLQRLQKDYREVDLPKGSIIYCDIPYRSSKESYTKDKEVNNFDYEAFYRWASHQTERLVVSEYDMPSDRFVKIAEKTKTSLLASNGTNGYVKEGLWIPIHQQELWR